MVKKQIHPLIAVRKGYHDKFIHRRIIAGKRNCCPVIHGFLDLFLAFPGKIHKTDVT